MVVFMARRVHKKIRDTRRRRKGAFANIEKGALHRALGIPQDKPIPMSLIRRLMKVPVGGTFTYKGKRKRMTTKLKRQVTFAYNSKSGKFKRR